MSIGIHALRARGNEKRLALPIPRRAMDLAALIDRWLTPRMAPSRIADQSLPAPLRALCVEAGWRFSRHWSRHFSTDLTRNPYCQGFAHLFWRQLTALALPPKLSEERGMT